MNKELYPTNPDFNPTVIVPEAYQSLKHKPFRLGDYYYLQEPTEELQQLLNSPTGSLPELLSHIFNRTHQSRTTVFPTLYKQLTELVMYTNTMTNNSPAYTVNLLFRESKLAGFQFTKTLTNTADGFYFTSYYNARITEKPITAVFAVSNAHLISLIDLLDEYDRTGFYIRTSYTAQARKTIKGDR